MKRLFRPRTEATASTSKDYYEIENYSPFRSYRVGKYTVTGLTPAMFAVTNLTPTADVASHLDEHPDELNMLNAYPFSALNLAVISYPNQCTLETIELLLTKGATIGSGSVEYSSGSTSSSLFAGSISSFSSPGSLLHPLYYVYKSETQTKANKLELVALLIKHGAKANDKLFRLAIDTDMPELVTQLVEAGFNINAKWSSHRDYAPLIYCIKRLKYEMVSTLLALGADVNLAGREDVSPFACAVGLGETDGKRMVDMLLGHEETIGQKMEKAFKAPHNPAGDEDSVSLLLSGFR